MKSEWKIQQLSNIVEFNPKETLKKGVIAKKISMDKLQAFCRDICEYELTKFTGGTKFRNGDTIMARITPCLENGKTAKINILNNGEIGFGSTEYIVFRAKEGISDPDFIYYLVTSSLIREPAIKSMVGSSGRQRVQSDVVEKIKINLPPLPVQKKIAGILKSLDDKIELNRQISKNLEEQARCLYQNMLKNAQIKTGTISDIGTVIGGGTPSKKRSDFYTDNGIAWITPKDLSTTRAKFTSRGADDITELGYKNSSAKLMPKGTILFSSRAPIGYISIAQNQICTNQGFKSVIPNSDIGTAFVYFLLKDKISIIENRASGSTFKEASTTLMNSIECDIPDKMSLKKFNKQCNAIFSMQETLQKENQKLASLRDTLLPKLMSGEIEV